MLYSKKTAANPALAEMARSDYGAMSTHPVSFKYPRFGREIPQHHARSKGNRQTPNKLSPWWEGSGASNGSGSGSGN